MDQIFQDLPFTFRYLDDILVASRDKQEHISHLHEVLSLLPSNGFCLNTAKGVWAVHQVEFLGHLIIADGILPLADRLEALKSLPRPSPIKELQAFLGLFSRFIKQVAEEAWPLTDALKGGMSSASKLEWSLAITASFWNARTALSATCSLDHPSATTELSLATDASSSHVGGVLQQRCSGGQWWPLGFYSS
jgi:hypothetical protein